MRLMKHFSVGLLLATLVASSSARAGSELNQAANNWSGFYAGLSAGGAWYNGGRIGGSSNVDAAVAAYNAQQHIGKPQATAVPLASIGTQDAGVSAGGLAGYNFQAGMLVLGAEADFSFIDVKSERSASGNSSITNNFLSFYAPTAYFSQDAVSKIDWYGTARLRFGLTPVPRVLIYGTGGLAFGGVQTSMSVVTTYSDSNIFPQTWQASHSQVSVGWTVGAGAEYLLTRNITIGAQYMYIDLGGSSVTATYQGPQVNSLASQIYYTANRANQFSVARATLNYKFN